MTPTPSSQDHIEKLLSQFDEKVNEIRRDTHWGNNQDGPVHEFGLKVQRFDAEGDCAELFTVPDWGNIKHFLSSSLHQLAEAQKEKALEIVRGLSTEGPRGTFFLPTLSEVEEAIKRDL